VSTSSKQSKFSSLPNIKLWWLLAGGSAIAGVLIGLIGQIVPSTLDSQFQIDLWLNANGNSALDHIASAAGEVYSPKFAITITIATSLLVWLVTKSRIDALAISVITAFGWLPAEAFKLLIDEGRPNQSLLARMVVAPETDNAFPSGHTCFAIAFGYALFLLFRTSRFKNLVLILWIASVVVMAWARLYSGVHYFTDVIGSSFASLTGLLLIGFLWNRFVTPRLSKAGRA
jgi:membrane-associated phospholipid phosphatase